jgi:DNA-binding XRE family transcriptional regulator
VKRGAIDLSARGMTMYIYYDDKTDYLEVLEKKVLNYSVPMKNGIFKILSEKSKKVIGYGIEGVSQRMGELDVFNPFVKLSIMIKVSRIRHQYSQSQMAAKLKIGLLPYQRLESGENNPTLKTLIKVKEVLRDIDLSLVA